jgi:hypothetical protein
MAKRQMEDDEERGWSSGGEKWVCPAHVEDEALERLIADSATSTSCSYCDREDSEPFAAELDVLIERIGTSIPHEWANADNEGVGWEGGYVGKTYDSYDLLTDGLEGPLNHFDLIGDVARALPQHSWAQLDYYRLRPHERLRFGWEAFGDIVKYRRRYFFADHRLDAPHEDPDYVAPGEMLAAIGETIAGAGLVRELPEGTPVFRLRGHSAAEAFETARDLGAPPANLIKSSARMSAAGVPMFYGALDEATATTEARDTNPNAEAFTLAQFALRRPVHVVDLARELEVPSLFDPEQRHLRTALIFLRYFAQAIAQPFVRDAGIHIEYVPTQIVTEWLRTRFKPDDGAEIVGILYRSARGPGVAKADEATNVALFIDNDGACDTNDENETAMLVLANSRRLD